MTTRQAGGIALVLLVISVFLTMVFRGIELVEERGSLYELRDMQENALRETVKLHHQFDALAAGVTALAADGDSNAQAVVEEMRREGVNLPAAKR